MLEYDKNVKTTGFVPVRQSGVLIADPGGKLKLARWRLQSDGHRVHYVQDLSLVESIVRNEEIQITLFNVGGVDDLESLKTINNIKGASEILVITPGTGHLKKMISAAGVKKVISRPIDYPQLSNAVRAELDNIKERKRKRHVFERFRKAITGPLNMRVLYKNVLDQIKPGILIVDPSGKSTFINKQMSALLEIDLLNVLEKPFDELLARSSCPFSGSLLDGLTKAFSLREDSFNSIVIEGSEDSKSWNIEAHPILAGRNEFIGAFVSAEVIAKPSKMDKGMVQSEQLAMVGQLAAGAAHEIRNPLTSVRGFIQLLQNELQGTSKGEYINIIIAEIDRVNTIVNEFLKLAKPATPKRMDCSIKDLFEDIHILIESEAFLKNIDITKDFLETLPHIQIDSEQVKQVLINIIRNSFEAMPGGGTMSVHAFELPKEREVCLEISDTGEGMDEETVKKIFEPFFTTKDNGTGLGLAVSSEIMKSNGGRMEVESRLGRGTTTHLYFPYK